LNKGGSTSQTGYFAGASAPGTGSVGTNVGPTAGGSSTAATVNQYACVYDIYDINSTTTYGNLMITPESSGTNNDVQTGAHPYLFPANSGRGYTVNSSGQTKNIVSPIFFQIMQYGIPTVFVTGVCDIYMTKGGIGTTGDIIQIGGVDYTYFDLSSSSLTSFGISSYMGLAMLTS
jgi:hypothetical protein